MPRSATGRRTTEFSFTRDSSSSQYWTCRFSAERKKGSTSYENLPSHVRTAHSNFEEIISEDKCTSSKAYGVGRAVIDKFPETTSKLTANATIVDSPVFKAAIVKVQSDNQRALSCDESYVLSGLKIHESEEETPTEMNLLFAQRVLKRQRVSYS
eukprot:IDg2151t1